MRIDAYNRVSAYIRANIYSAFAATAWPSLIARLEVSPKGEVRTEVERVASQVGRLTTQSQYGRTASDVVMDALQNPSHGNLL